MGSRRDLSDIHAEEMQNDPEYRAYWERTALACAVALRLIGYRVEHGLTQTALANRLGMCQPAIARLEAGEYNPSLETLLRISGVLGIEFLLHIVPASQPAQWSEPNASTAKVLETVDSARTSSTLLVAAT